MDSLTHALFRCLQHGPFDESGLKRIRGLLRTQRRVLRAQKDQTTLGDVVQLLQQWADASTEPQLAANALAEAAEIAEMELRQPVLANELRTKAGAQRSMPPRGPSAASDHAALGEERAVTGDVNGAIEAYEQALNEVADMDIARRLAELYVRRAGPGDATQAADLFFTLGDVLGNPEGIPMLERALEQDPGHSEARTLLEQYSIARASQVAAASRASARASDPQPSRASARASDPQPSRAPIAPSAALSGSPQPSATDPRGSQKGPPPLRANSGRLIAPVGVPPKITLVSNKPAGTAASAHPSPSRTAANSEPASAARTQAGLGPAPTATRTAAGIGSPAPSARGQQSARARATDPSVPFAQLREPASQPNAAPAHTALKVPAPARASRAPAYAAPPHHALDEGSDQLELPASSADATPQMPLTSLSPVEVDDDGPTTESHSRGWPPRKHWLAGAGAVLIGAAAAAALFLMTPSESSKDSLGSLPSAATSQPPPPPPIAAPLDAPGATAAPAPTADPTKPSPGSREPAAPATGETGDPTQGEAAKSAEAPAAGAAPAAEPKLPGGDAAERPEASDSAAAKPAETAVKPAEVTALLPLAVVRGGKLTEAQLTTAMSKLTPKLEACYAQTLEKKPRTKGRLIFNLTVKLNGKVTGTKKQGGTIKDADLIRCSSDAIDEARFPKPRKQAAKLKLAFEYRHST